VGFISPARQAFFMISPQTNTVCELFPRIQRFGLGLADSGSHHEPEVPSENSNGSLGKVRQNGEGRARLKSRAGETTVNRSGAKQTPSEVIFIVQPGLVKNGPRPRGRGGGGPNRVYHPGDGGAARAGGGGASFFSPMRMGRGPRRPRRAQLGLRNRGRFFPVVWFGRPIRRQRVGGGETNRGGLRGRGSSRWTPIKNFGDFPICPGFSFIRKREGEPFFCRGRPRGGVSQKGREGHGGVLPTGGGK